MATRRPTSNAPRPAASPSLLEHLREAVQAAVEPWPGVGRKKMLVSIGWTRHDRVFALVSRQGRIVVRLPDEAARRELSALEGTAPWQFGTRAPPRDWLLLPESMHDDEALLRSWLRRAWELGGEPQASGACRPARPRPTRRPRVKQGSSRRSKP
jgi:TfoX/Sxy family transcriptional regulator of competence genes